MIELAEIELKPCPVCGDEAAMFDDPLGWQIHCLGPFDCRGRTQEPNPDPEKVLAAWRAFK